MNMILAARMPSTAHLPSSVETEAEIVYTWLGLISLSVASFAAYSQGGRGDESSQVGAPHSRLRDRCLSRKVSEPFKAPWVWA